LCVEIITNIDVVNEYGNEYEVNFLIKPLTHVLLARPRSLKSIDFDLDELDVVDRVFGEDLFRQLSFALEVEEIVLNLDLVVPGSLLRDIGERCTKLKKLDLKNIKCIDGPFDSPIAFPALESLRFHPFFLGQMPDEKRNAIEPPDFSHFSRLTSVTNVLWNAKWALSLANAPCLTSISDGDGNSSDSTIYLTKEELRAFFKACQGPIRTSLTSISLYDFKSVPRPVDDATAIALLEAFPMLEELKIRIDLSFSEPFLNKLKQAKHLKNLELQSNEEGIRPTRAWLAESCPRFPKTLESLKIYFLKFEPDEDDLQGGSKEEYIEFIEASFRSCLPKLAQVKINCW